jgi:hypothetical protein
LAIWSELPPESPIKLSPVSSNFSKFLPQNNKGFQTTLSSSHNNDPTSLRLILYVNQFLVLWQIPGKNSLWKKIIILADSSRDFSAWLADPIAMGLTWWGRASWWQGMVEESVLMTAWKQKDREGPGTRCTFPGHTSSDLLPPAKPHFLSSTTSKVAQPAGDQVFNTRAGRGQFIVKPWHSLRLIQFKVFLHICCFLQ